VKIRQPLLALVLAQALAGVPGASGQVSGSVPNGRVASGSLSFDGHATAGDFVGSTTTVSGQLTSAPDIARVRGWVEAPVKTLKTGNGKRDKDLNKSMESDKYPTLRFDLARITPTAGAGDSLGVILHGTLTIHGVTRNIDAPGTVQFQGPTARVRTDFPLNLKDYKIGGLSKMLGILKMHENIEVHSDLVFQLDKRS
jgi:polyisoprenoid-binding protein YceI